MRPERTGLAPAIAAGIVAGLAGLAVFLLLHHAWIVPIWFIAPVGAVMAGLGGAAVGASYAELRHRLPRGRPWRAVAVAGTYALVVVPAIAFAEVTGPIFAMDGSGGGALIVPGEVALADVTVGLFGACALSGVIVGALIGRSVRAAALTALAGVALAVGPGHNVPMLGATATVPKELTVLAAVLLISSIVLVEAEARLATQRGLTSS